MKVQVQVHLSFLESFLFGSLDARITRAEVKDWLMVLTIEGTDVPSGEGPFRVETVVSTTSTFVPVE